MGVGRDAGGALKDVDDEHGVSGVPRRDGGRDGGQCHQGKACEVPPSRDGSMDRGAMVYFLWVFFLAEPCSS